MTDLEEVSESIDRLAKAIAAKPNGTDDDDRVVQIERDPTVWVVYANRASGGVEVSGFAIWVRTRIGNVELHDSDAEGCVMSASGMARFIGIALRLRGETEEMAQTRLASMNTTKNP